MNTTAVQAAAIGQTVLKQFGAADLVSDGNWGTYTQEVYNRASPAAKSTLSAVLSATGWSVQKLQEHREMDRFRGAQQAPVGELVGRSRKWGDADAETQTKLREAINSAALRLGVPPRTALTIARIESGFNPSAVSPTGAVGPFQITSIAQADVAERGGFSGDRRKVFDNIDIGIRYMKIVARDLGVTLDDVSSIYMGFNIGPSGARQVRAGNPQAAASVIAKQAFGPPAQYAANLRAKVNQFMVA
jgi:soluble lytic murein transglycosylase-like protein